MFAKEETTDLYAAIDLAVEKLEHQAQKLAPSGRSTRAPSGAPDARADEADAAPSGERQRPRVIPRRVLGQADGTSTRRSRRSADRATSSLVFTNASHAAAGRALSAQRR